MPNPEKITAVKELKKLFEDADSFFVTDYQGLNVADITVLRKNFRENNIKFLVAKNTLFRRAAAEAEVEGVEEFLTGPTAIAFGGDDPVTTAKIIQESYKVHKLPRVKVFVVDDTQYDAEDLKRFAELPTREVLLSQVIASVEAPLTELVGTIDGFFRKLIGTIDALADKRKNAGE